jgi:N-acetylmuramoyl-L-alanine amidase
MAIEAVNRPSPNFNSRKGAAIDCIVIHDTESATAAAALSWFESPGSQASAHYVIDRDGTIYRCVEEGERAWHAGVSALRGRSDVNTFSVGLELVGVSTQGYTEDQLQVLVKACVDLMQRYHGITISRMVSHQEIALPPGRKHDPGPNFPWVEFRSRVQLGLNATVV